MAKRTLGVAAVFLVGCAVGGVSSQLVVPKASAQQAATLTRWEMHCVPIRDSLSAEAQAAARVGDKLGAEGWEPAMADDQVWCWKRPKM
jgi:hypothetical protein